MESDRESFRVPSDSEQRRVNFVETTRLFVVDFWLP